MTGLTDFQREVASAFFSLDAARDFVLAGGAALIAHDLIDRSTGDLDLFTISGEQLGDVVSAFAATAATRGWNVSVLRQSDTFARVEVSDPDANGLVIDLGVDSAPALAPAASDVGPTYQPAELAARKLLALFGRAEARDISDVYHLSDLFELEEMCELAVRIDPGFTRSGLIDALHAIDRFADEDFPPTVRPDDVRDFARQWQQRLSDEA